MNLRASGVSHESHAHLLHDPGFHQACVKGVAEIVETDMAALGVLERRLPRALHDADRLAIELDHRPSGLPVFEQEFVEAPGKRNLAGFSFWSF